MLLKDAVIEKILISKRMLVFFPLRMTLKIAKHQGHNIFPLPSSSFARNMAV